jgi:nucleotide-binding universal stress UspA family protein
MIRRIVVGLNGTQFSRAAADLATKWAKHYDAELIGVAVVDLPRITAPQAVPIGASAFKAERDREAVRNAHLRAEEVLREFEAQCQAAAVRFTTHKLEGNPPEVLARESQRGDLLVIGGKALPEEYVDTPRVVEHVLRIAPRPVVCVPTNVTELGDAVLVAYDGSAQAAKALQVFLATGLATGRPIHLLTVTREGERNPAALAAEYLLAHGVPVEVNVQATQVSPAKAILAEARRLNAGLIVAGSYGQPLLKELFFGSVTETLLRESSTPLLLYH